jgi:ribonuclease P protein component
MTARLPRQARVRVRAEFDRSFQQGSRTASPLLALHWLRDDAPARLGLAVSRKVDTRAVVRNRIKRALRECFRRLRASLPGGSYIVVARAAAASCDGATLQDTFVTLLQRAGALPASGAPGTMPGVSASPRHHP